MAYDFVQRDSATGNPVTVDNGNSHVVLPLTAAQAGYAKIAGKDGSPLKVLATGYLAASLESLEFYDTIDGNSVNTNLWNQSVSGMTITQASGKLSLNPTNVVTANAYAILSSIPNFLVTSCTPLHLHKTIQNSLWNTGANTVVEFGWGAVATNVALPTDGMLVRGRAGVIYAVVNNGGSELEIALTPTFALPSANVSAEWVLDLYANELRVYVDGVLWTTGATACVSPTSLMAATNNSRQPVFFRVYNTASAPGASPTLSLGQITVQQRNSNIDKPWSHRMLGMGRGAYQNPLTFGQTANWGNSAVPTTRGLSNTTPCEATLGGLLRFTPTYVADTDYVLFGFQVPAGFQYYLTGISYTDPIFLSGTGAATASVLQFGVGVNASAASLATADGAGTWGYRKEPLGQSILAASPTNITVPSSPGLNMYKFPTPGMLIEGGRYFAFIARALLARTAGASEVFHMSVFPHGYYD
jgi:hypothetical protein